MTWTYTEDYYRNYTRTTWNESAAVYVEFMDRLEPYRRDLLRRVAARPGERALDIATGPGEPAFSLAHQVAPGGSVVGIDLSENMVGLARAEAAKRGVRNVAFEVMDAENVSLPDASFDIAVSAFGLQIVTDPEKVAREAHRVVRPGGRVGFTVWGPGERVPAIHAIIGPMLKHAEPDESGYLPTPYEMGGPGEACAFLEQAGFHDAREERVAHPWRFRDADDYLRVVLHGSPIGHSLREEPESIQAQVLRETRENLQRHLRPDGLVLPAEAVVVTALR